MTENLHQRFNWFILSFCLELSKVKVKPGEDATLQCDGPKDAPITLLTSDGYVFFYRDEHLFENYLHPSFVGRVELNDKGMKGGDVSVILKNVTNSDTGTYDCFVSVSKTSRRNRATPDFSKTIELLVEDSGEFVESRHRSDVYVF